MTAMTRPRVDRTTPGELVSWVLSGRIRIPSFQRSYRWERDDVVKLFDSILRGYPIGSLLMWQRPAEAATLHFAQIFDRLPQEKDRGEAEHLGLVIQRECGPAS